MFFWFFGLVLPPSLPSSAHRSRFVFLLIYPARSPIFTRDTSQRFPDQPTHVPRPSYKAKHVTRHPPAPLRDRESTRDNHKRGYTSEYIAKTQSKSGERTGKQLHTFVYTPETWVENTDWTYKQKRKQEALTTHVSRIHV